MISRSNVSAHQTESLGALAGFPGLWEAEGAGVEVYFDIVYV